MSEKDPIKEAFSRAKQDIQALKDKFNIVINEIQEIKRTLMSLSTQQSVNQSNQQENPTDDWPYKRLKPHIYNISIGNRGVPTDKPTDRQTNQQTDNFNRIDQIERVSEILESLGTIKKDLRTKFKRLTSQEMLVFSTLYQLQEEGFIVDYSTIAQKLSLSESSIRDYIQRIAKKGIPIQKTKENNKKILLNIPQEFKQIASLQTIIQLREL